MFAFLARLILIVIAISVVRSVFAWILRLFASAGQQARASQSRPASQKTPPSAPPAMALEQDPVCGTYVSVDTSLKRIVQGKVYHFCSETCKDRFAA
jgi:YHS domain-containing protein